MAGLYAVYHGPDRLRMIATRVHRLASILATGLEKGGIPLETESYFDTLTVRIDDAGAVHERARAAGYNLRAVDESRIGISLDERTSRVDIEMLWNVFGADAANVDAIDANAPSGLPAALQRKAGTSPTHRSTSIIQRPRYCGTSEGCSRKTSPLTAL